MLTVGVRSHDYGKDTPKALFSRIAKDGYQAVMLAYQKAIAGVSSYDDVTPEIVAQTTAALRENQLAINTLGVYMELGMVDEAERGKAVAQFLTGLKVAKETGAANVATETTPFHKQPDAAPQDALKSLYRSLEEILPTAEEYRLKVCVEPVFYHTLSSPQLTKQLLKDFATPWLAVTFDPVNLFQPRHVHSQKALWDVCFDYFGSAVEVVHMKGIRVENGELKKCGFEDSVIDYPYLFRQLKACGKPLHIIREEADPHNGKAEAAFLQSLCSE